MANVGAGAGSYEPADRRGRTTGGWNSHQFHANSEFYADFGRFVVETLDELRARGLATGVISNFEAWLDDLLARLDVRDRFPIRVISGVEGVEKPDPAIFERAIERSGVGASDAVYVGDNPEFDGAPAAAVGALVSVPAAAAVFTVLFAVGGTTPVDTGAVFAAMVGWHTVIGIGEAVITGLVVAAVVAARPDLCYGARPLLRDRPLELRTEVAK